MKAALIAALGSSLALLWASAAAAAPPCSSDLRITKALLGETLSEAPVGLAGGAGHPDLVEGYWSYLREGVEDDPRYGTVYYIRNQAGWRALLPVDGENVVALFVSRAQRRAIAISQLQIEGPGQSFTIVSADEAFAGGACAVIPFPYALNHPQWRMETLEVHSLALDARGRGMLVTYANLERDNEKPRTLWYGYRTHDGGVSWSRPKRLRWTRGAKGGAYAQVVMKEEKTLSEALKAATAANR